MELENYICHIPGFPKEGILFHDITLCFMTLKHYATLWTGWRTLRARGTSIWFWRRGPRIHLGRAVAYVLGVGFAAARKPGKLPRRVSRCEYDLEYGTDALEVHADAISPGQRVLHPRRFAGHGRHCVGQDPTRGAGRRRGGGACLPHRVDRPQGERASGGLRGLQPLVVRRLIVYLT